MAGYLILSLYIVIPLKSALMAGHFILCLRFVLHLRSALTAGYLTLCLCSVLKFNSYVSIDVQRPPIACDFEYTWFAMFSFCFKERKFLIYKRDAFVSLQSKLYDQYLTGFALKK